MPAHDDFRARQLKGALHTRLRRAKRKRLHRRTSDPVLVQGSSQCAAGPRSCFCEEQKPKGVSADRGARPQLRKPEQRSARIADSDREWEHGGPTTDRLVSQEA